MLRYKGAHWKDKAGFKIRNFDLTIDTIDLSKTREEEQTGIEKISLVTLLRKEQKKPLLPKAGVLKERMDFYQNNNLHLTLTGIGPLEKKHHEKIRGKIR